MTPNGWLCAGASVVIFLCAALSGKADEIQSISTLATIPISGADVQIAAVSSDGKAVAISSGRGADSPISITVIATDSEKPRTLQTFELSDSFIPSMAFSPSGNKLVVVSGRIETQVTTHVSIYNLEDGSVEAMHQLPGKVYYQAAVFDNKGVALVAGSELLVDTAAIDQKGSVIDREGVVVWDARTGKRITGVKTLCNSYWSKVSLSPDCRLLAIGPPMIFLPNKKQSVEVWLLRPTPKRLLIDAGIVVDDLTLSSDGTRVGVASHRGEMKVFDIANQRALQSLKVDAEGTERFGLAKFSGDLRLVAASNGYRTRLWRLDIGRMTGEWPIAYSALAFAKNGTILAVAGKRGSQLVAELLQINSGRRQ